MLQPKKTKYDKQHKGRIKGNATRGTKLCFGKYGIKSLDPGWITDRQIESARVAATRYMKRQGKLWLNIFPDKPVTKKPQEVRMSHPGFSDQLLNQLLAQIIVTSSTWTLRLGMKLTRALETYLLSNQNAQYFTFPHNTYFTNKLHNNLNSLLEFTANWVELLIWKKGKRETQRLLTLRVSSSN